MINVGLSGVGLRNDKVQVSVFGMAKNNAVFVVVFIEQVLYVHYRFAQSFYGKRKIFHQRRSAFCPHSRDRRIHTFANFPQQRLFLRILGKIGLKQQR